MKDCFNLKRHVEKEKTENEKQAQIAITAQSVCDFAFMMRQTDEYMNSSEVELESVANIKKLTLKEW